jgi:hypothetical protein
MQHTLDNPIYDASICGNSGLANDVAEAKYFDKNVLPFVALLAPEPSYFNALYNMLSPSNLYGFIFPEKIDIPAPWEVLQLIGIVQMVYSSGECRGEDPEIVRLSSSDVGGNARNHQAD